MPAKRTTSGFLTTVTFDPAAVAANTCAEQDVTVNGVLPDFIYFVNAPALEAGITLDNIARCTAKNVLKLRFCNITGSSVNPASQSFEIRGF